MTEQESKVSGTGRSPSKYRTRDEEEITLWLQSVGLKQYADLFVKEKISFNDLPYLEESHYKEMGIPVGDRIKFKQALGNDKIGDDSLVHTNSSEETTSQQSQEKKSVQTPSPNSSWTSVPTPKRSQEVPIPTKKDSQSQQQRTLAQSAPNLSHMKPQIAKPGPTMSPNKPTPEKVRSPQSLVSPTRKAAPAVSSIEPDMEEYQCKIVVIGPPATGKTSLVRRFTQDQFQRIYKQTIGVDFEVKTVQWSESVVVHVQLWDIAGQERFNAVVPQFYRSTAAALVVYDMADESTLQLALKWNDHLQKHEIQPSGKNIPVMLLANKCDLVPQDKYPNLDGLCKENGFVKWWPTSAKNNVGINEAVNYLLDIILNTSGIDTGKTTEKNTIDLSKNKTSNKSSSQENECAC